MASLIIIITIIIIIIIMMMIIIKIIMHLCASRIQLLKINQS